MSNRKIKSRDVADDLASNVTLPDIDSIITVVGVGGAGGNAVDYMYRKGIENVEFLLCNTDAQDLAKSDIKNKICLGDSGLGAGCNPEAGREATLASRERIKAEFQRLKTKMVFLATGMGGGTGTGATPIIAEIAKEMGILTVAVVTFPRYNEGSERLGNAIEGVRVLRECVDSILIIKNDNVLKMYPDIDSQSAFDVTDDVLNRAVKGIAEIVMSKMNRMNADFADVSKVLRENGRAHLGLGEGEGANRAKDAVDNALVSSLLDKDGIVGATQILVQITVGSMSEVQEAEINFIINYLREKSCIIDIYGRKFEANVDKAYGPREGLGGKIQVVLVATRFANVDIEDEYSLAADAENSIEKLFAIQDKVNMASVARGEEVILPLRATRFPQVEQAVLQAPAYLQLGINLCEQHEIDAMMAKQRRENS